MLGVNSTEKNAMFSLLRRVLARDLGDVLCNVGAGRRNAISSRKHGTRDVMGMAQKAKGGHISPPQNTMVWTIPSLKVVMFLP